MKYLKNRDNFITGVKKTGMVPYINEKIDVEKMNEAFQNDITWGDSLIGRLINSVIRKGKIGLNLKRIESVIKSMRYEFDRLLSDAVISKMETESKIKLYKFIMITLVGQLERAVAVKDDWVITDKSEDVDDVEDVEEVKNMTVSTIETVGDYFDTLNDASLGIPANELAELKKDRDDLIVALEKFLESLKEIKGDEKEEQVDEPEDKTQEPKKEIVYSDLLKKNFSLVYDIVCDYNAIIISATRTSADESTQKGKTTTVTNKPGTKLEPEKTETVTKQTASFNHENGFFSINEEAAIIDPEFVKAIKPLHSYFKANKFTLPQSFDDRRNEFSKLLDSNKDGVVRVYKALLLIKENLVSDLLTKPENVAKHIHTLYNFTKTKTSGIIKGFEKSKAGVFEFNKSMLEILKSKTPSGSDSGDPVKSEDELEIGKTYNYTNSKGEEKKGLLVSKDTKVSKGKDGKFLTGDDVKGEDLEPGQVAVATKKSGPNTFSLKSSLLRKESFISSYLDFITEAEEANEGETWITKVNDSWKNTFLADFKNYKSYVLTREEQDKLKAQVDKAEKATSSYKIITDRDPVIEIVRLFNRAFRLHTPGPIPSGRSVGKVSNITFREYEFVGGGSGSAGTPDNPGGGPYRNIKVFTKWQDAIYDIIGGAKYRVIFNKDSVLQVGEGDPIPAFGKKLLDFMNEMLDNSKMYNQGEQQKFIQKYFDIELKEKDVVIPEYKTDAEKNDDTSGKIEQTELEFDKKDKIVLSAGMTFKLKDNEDETWYCWVQSARGKNAYIRFSRNGSYLNSYLDTTTRFKTPTSNQSDNEIFIGKFEIDNLTLESNKTLKIVRCLNISKDAKGKTDIQDSRENLSCKSFEVVTKEKDGEKKVHLIQTPKAYLANVDKKQGQKPYNEMLDSM